MYKFMCSITVLYVIEDVPTDYLFQKIEEIAEK